MTKKARKAKYATPTGTKAGDGRAKRNGKATKAKKRALLAGINDYPEEINDLGSCVADVVAMRYILERVFGFDEVISLTDAEVTPANLTGALDRLFTGVTSSDRLVLYYSGHGYQMIDGNGVKQEFLVLSDGSLFQDDELVNRAANLPPGVLTVIFDSCFSGGMEKLFLESARLASQADKSIVHSDTGLKTQITAKIVSSTLPPQIGRIKTYIPSDLDSFIKDQQTEPPGGFKSFGSATRKIDGFGQAGISKEVILNVPSDETREPVLNGLLISACTENEVASADTPFTSGLSAFTYGLLQTLSRRGGRISAVTLAREITSTLRSMGFRQSPQIKEPSAPGGMSQLSFIELTPIESWAQPPISPTTLNGDSAISQIVEYIRSLLSAQPYKRQTLFESTEDIQKMYTQPGVDLQSILPQLLLASLAQGSQPAGVQGKGVFEDLGRNLIPTLLEALSRSQAGQPTWGMAGGFPGGISPTFPSPLPPPFLEAVRDAISKSLGGQPTWGMAGGFPGGQERFLGSLLPLLGPVLIPPIVDAVRETLSRSQAGQPTWGMAGGFPGGQEKILGSLLPFLAPVLIPPIVDAVREVLSKSQAGQPTWGMAGGFPGGQGRDIFGDMGRALGSILIPSLVDAVRDAIAKSPGLGSQLGH